MWFPIRGQCKHSSIRHCYGDMKPQTLDTCKWQSINDRACAHTTSGLYCLKHNVLLFQIWWRSVHKWRHNLVHRRRTDGRTDGSLRDFYRSMLKQWSGHAIAWRLSVCPSVCLSVTLVIPDHIHWGRSNFITRLISLRSPHAKFQRSSAKGTFSNLGLNRGGVGKIGFFQPISRPISETVRDRAKVTIDH